MKKLAARVLDALKADPMGWRFDGLTAQYGELEIWTANAPFQDLDVRHGDKCGPRIGNWWTRRKIRRAMREAIELQAIQRMHGTEKRG